MRDIERFKPYPDGKMHNRILKDHVDEFAQPVDKCTAKLAALTRSMQQIANLEPSDFNSANKAVSMAKAALLIVNRN